MSEQPKRKAVQAPVSAHPAFPAIVALWFAALFGIGSLVLPITLFESASQATGLATVFAAAQAPLGVTARIVVALAAGALGVFAGLAIARQVIGASEPRSAPRRAPAMRSAKRPISAHEEFGEGGIDDDAPEFTRGDALPGRRRALSVTDDSARSELLDHAPLPGQDLFAPPHGDPAPEAIQEPLDEPLDLAEFDAAPADAEHAPIDAPARFDPNPLNGLAFGTAALSGPPVPGASFTRSEPHRAPATAPLTAAEDHPLPADSREPSVADAAMVHDNAAQSQTPSEHSAGEPGIVDLVERFARALQQRREQAERAADAELVVDVTFALPGKDAAAAIAPQSSSFAPPAKPPVPVVPAALRPVGFDEHDIEEDDELPPLGLSLVADRPFPAPAHVARAEIPAGDVVEEQEEHFVESEESYSSLLAMKSPFGLPREAVRIEDDTDDGEPAEPVVVFPGQSIRRAAPAVDGPARDAAGFGGASLRPFDAPAVRIDAIGGQSAPIAPLSKPADAGATERALREALEKLQRMSGTA